MDDLLRDFLTESTESLAQIDTELVKLEQNPNNPSLLSSIFRLVHTIKGTCGFLGLQRLEKVAHAAENVLGKFRDGQLSITPAAVSVILRSIDTIKGLISTLEEKESEPEGNDDELISALNAISEGGQPASVVAPPVAPPPVEPQAAAPAPKDEIPFTPITAAEMAAKVAAEKAPPPKAVKPADLVKAGEETPVKESAVANQSIRISVDLIEKQMQAASELVLSRNQLMQILRTQKDSAFAAPLQRLNHVTSELQESVMKMRMQPIGNAWGKLPRIVRDLSVELGKKIDLQMVGADTELDRQVLEIIKDPLTHMVRNSADHGIEMPSDRMMSGKPETGTILLNAYHEGGHILIEISDDGRGLSLDKIKAKALQSGLVTESDLSTMSDQQVMQFIFRPGFSTAAKVTAVSGRGVGMDVVKTNLEKIGGTVDLQSTEGKGSRFLIKIPLTLAIVSALIVECGGERFAIPQICVVELVHASAQSEHRIEHINGTPVLRLRNHLLPLISLRQTLHLGEEKTADTAFIIVVQVGSTNFGIIVDRVFDTEEIVVKPVSTLLRNISMFSGNTILGDGSVIMILDPNGLAARVGEIHGATGMVTKQAAQTAHAHVEGVQSLLLFRADDLAPKAVPLSLVARLEEIDLKSVEYSDSKPVVQYRGKLMPLVPMNDDFQLKKEGMQPILVFTDKERNMGLIVDEIIDIVEDQLRVNLSVKRPGFLGSAIIVGHATDIVDTGHYLAQAYQDWFGTQENTAFGGNTQKRVLLVDDSPFFRNLLAPLLTVAGYEVSTAENAEDALKLQEAGEDFDVIISDIEMPGMNGFEFVSAVKQDGRWKGIPFIGLSSHSSPRDVERGRSAGFDDYVAKFNRDALLASIQAAFGEKGAQA